jgi:hypothetical protein
MFVAMALCAALVGIDPQPQSKTDEALIEAGRRIGVHSILTGAQDPVLQSLALEQARYSAAHGLGHQLFGQQYARHNSRYPKMRSIAAQSWPGQDAAAGASACYEAWKQSPGHWAICNGRCRTWGFSMVQGSDGIWYGIGFCAD